MHPWSHLIRQPSLVGTILSANVSLEEWKESSKLICLFLHLLSHKPSLKGSRILDFGQVGEYGNRCTGSWALEYLGTVSFVVAVLGGAGIGERVGGKGRFLPIHLPPIPTIFTPPIRISSLLDLALFLFVPSHHRPTCKGSSLPTSLFACCPLMNESQ